MDYPFVALPATQLCVVSFLDPNSHTQFQPDALWTFLASFQKTNQIMNSAPPIPIHTCTHLDTLSVNSK